MMRVSVVPSIKTADVSETLTVADPIGFLQKFKRPSVGPDGKKQDDAPLFVLGHCIERAADETWQGSDWFMLDIDGGDGTPPLEEAVRRAEEAGLAVIAGPSTRDGVDGKHRYRLLFRTDRVINRPHAFKRTAASTAARLGFGQAAVDPRSFVPSQRWYGFNPTHVRDGDAVKLEFGARVDLPSPEEITQPANEMFEGNRAQTIFRIACAIGNLAHVDLFDAPGARAKLHDLAVDAGLTPAEADMHIGNGIRRGLADPTMTLVGPPSAKYDPDGLARWRLSLRVALELSITVCEYGKGRVLFRRGADGRQLTPIPDRLSAVAAIREVAKNAGLYVSTQMGENVVADLLTSWNVEAAPTLYDQGTGTYRYRQPRIAQGPTPAWDSLLNRITDPDAFLAHVWALFEPKWTGRQVLWLQGEGNDGKTIAIRALAAATFGEDELAVADDSRLRGDSQFLFASLWDKPLVLVPDTKNTSLVMKGLVHRLVGRDPMAVEYKHQSPFTAAYEGAVWVTSNPMPSLENTVANVSRLTLLRVAPPTEFIEEWPAKLRAEVPALLYRAKQAYAARHHNHNVIRVNTTAENDRDRSTSHVDDLYESWAERAGIEFDPAAPVLRAVQILKRLESIGQRPMNSDLQGFYAWLVRNGAIRTDAARVSFTGVRLRQ